MMRSLFLALCLLLLPVSSFAQVTVGEYVSERFETSHPYEKPGSTEPVLVQREEIVFPGATYIAPHFSVFDLAPGDFVVVRSPDQQQHWVYTGLGRHHLGRTPDGFFATHIKGDSAIIELFASGDDQAYGFTIDFYGRGYSNQEILEFWQQGVGEEMNLPYPQELESRAVCTADDSLEAACYETSEPAAFEKSRAVARLLLSGATHCTGWLIGCEGHVMTNEHCIENQNQANQIDFEFMAQGATCDTVCASPEACPGTIEASGGTLVDVNPLLDYALVIPDTSTGSNTDLPGTYGYMRFRPTGPVLGERLYLPQHPAGWGKRIAMESSYPADKDGFTRVVSLEEPACTSGAPAQVGYWADTRGGSSGSPVLGYSDNLIIALHNCQGLTGCSSGTGSDTPNLGVNVVDVINGLGSAVPNCALCDVVPTPTNLTAVNAGDNRIDISWDPVNEANEYRLYRIVAASGSCTPAEFELIADNLTTTSHSDTDVGGGVTYAYAVEATILSSNCTSERSDCVSVTATGSCLLLPEFPGASAIENQRTDLCGIRLFWEPAQPFCSQNVVYNIYRETTPEFTPSAKNMVASCLTATEWMDNNVVFDQTYYYLVRAEDTSGNGTGLCGDGLEETNIFEVLTYPSGPDATTFADDLEQGIAFWTTAPGPMDTGSSQPWMLVDDASVSPTHSWFVADEFNTKDQTLVSNPLTIPAENRSRLTFYHKVFTEATWDGGVLEYSLDGTNWFDILAGDGATIPVNLNRLLANGYNGPLRGGPLQGRGAWFGTDNVWREVIVDLADFRGMNVSFRWRLSCDDSSREEGWWLDDVRLLTDTECLGCVEAPEIYSQWPVRNLLSLLQCL